MKEKNITRYTYDSTDFLGWRVSIQRRGRIITRYFSDLKYGNEHSSLGEAIKYRDAILEGTRLHRDHLSEYMDEQLLRVQELLHQERDKPQAGAGLSSRLHA